MNRIISSFNALKFRTKLTILLCFVGFVPIAVLGMTLSMNAHDMVEANRRDDMQNSLQNATASVVSQIAVCEQLMDYFAYDQNLINFLECDPEKKAERYGFYQEVCNTINAMEFQNLVMRTITVYSENIAQSFGEETQPIQVLKEQKWFTEMKEKDTFNWIYDSDNLKIMAVRRLTGYKGIESYLVVTCNTQSLLQSFSQLGVDNYGVHVGGEEEIWNYYEDKSLSFNGDVSRYISVSETIKKLNMEVIYYTPKEEVETVSMGAMVDISVRILFCVVVILLLGRVFSEYISRPLELLTREIQKVDSENMEVSIWTNRKDEIGSLIQSYNHMMRRIQELIQENYQTKIAQKEFEMKALQAQINPHFLYNSLSIINWKAIEANQKEISRITLDLSSFYRTTLNRGKTMNTIKNAVENIRAYLSIQLCMHDDNFVVHYDIDEDTYEYYIPALIFQPFVENSLEHGLDIKEDPDHQIWIRIGQDEGHVLVTVEDNGIGMTKEEAVQILGYDSKGYGVKNVNDRLMLRYGQEYGIQVESEPEKGTRVSLRIPKQVKGDGA